MVIITVRTGEIDRTAFGFAQGADLVAQRCVPDEAPDHDTSGDADKERDIGGGGFGEFDADWRKDLMQGGQLRAFGELGRGRVHGAPRFQHAHQHIVQHRCRDKVEHDGGDHDMTAAFGLQVGGDGRPCRTKNPGPHCGDKQCNRPMREGNIEADKGEAQPADHRLTFTTDVEQTGMGGDRHRKAGKEEIGGIIERVAPAIGGPQRAIDHQVQRLHRAFTDQQDHDCGNYGGQQQADHRDQHHIGPFWHLFHLRGLPRDAGHQEAEFFFIGLICGAFAHDLTVKHHRNPVAQRQDFLKLHRDQQDRLALVAQLHDLLVDKLDRADIDAAGGLAD